MRRLALPFLVGIACLTFLATPVSASDTAARGGTARLTTLERAVIREINAERTSRGLRPLKPSTALVRAAVTHSRAMLELGFFEHASPDGTQFADRIKRFYPPQGGWTVGENLAMFAGGTTPSARAVVEAWLASPPHRTVLLSPSFRELGLAVVFTPEGTGVYAGTPAWVVTLDVGARGAGLSS